MAVLNSEAKFDFYKRLIQGFQTKETLVRISPTFHKYIARNVEIINPSCANRLHKHNRRDELTTESSRNPRGQSSLKKSKI